MFITPSSSGKIGVRHSAWTPSAAPLTNFPVIGGHAAMALPRVYRFGFLFPSPEVR